MSSSASTIEQVQPSDPLAAADASTRDPRRARAVQLRQVHAVLAAGTWHRHGYRSPLAWLASTTSETPGVCAVTLELAERIQNMPIVRDRFERGDLAESALRLLSRAWHPDIAGEFRRDEPMLVGWALTLAHRDFKMVLDTWRLHADPDREERTAQDRFDGRKLHLSQLLDGMGRLDGLLDPEAMLLVSEAIRSLSARSGADDDRTPEQRRADALVTMAKNTLAAGDSSPGKKRNQPKVIATIGYDDLVANTAGGSIETNSGRIVVTAETIRRLSCDAGIHRLVAAPDGTILDFGRQTRTISDSLFDTLTIRDHGCRVGVCPAPPSACDAHHALHWADLGETEPDNLVLLCWYHHHLVHEQHWSIQPLGAGHFVLTDHHGVVHPMRPPLVGLALPQPQLPMAS